MTDPADAVRLRRMRVFFLVIREGRFSEGLVPDSVPRLQAPRGYWGGGRHVVNTCDFTGIHTADDALPLSPVRELCHDLLESAATIGLLAQVAGTEADPAVYPGSQLPSQLRLITAAARQVAAICAQVLDQCNPPAPVLMSPCDASMTTLPQAARHQGGPSR